MTVDLTKPIVTHHGAPARVLATDLPGFFPICIAREADRKGGFWMADTYTLDDIEDRFRNTHDDEATL